MRTGPREQAFIKAALLDELPDGGYREELAAFLDAETCTFTLALHAKIKAAGDDVLQDPDKREDARMEPVGWLHREAEQAEEDAAAEWLETAERIENLHIQPLRRAA